MRVPLSTNSSCQVKQQWYLHSGAGPAGGPGAWGRSSAASHHPSQCRCESSHRCHGNKDGMLGRPKRKPKNIHRCYWLVAKQKRSVRNIFGAIHAFTSKHGSFLVLLDSLSLGPLDKEQGTEHWSAAQKHSKSTLFAGFQCGSNKEQSNNLFGFKNKWPKHITWRARWSLTQNHPGSTLNLFGKIWLGWHFQKIFGVGCRMKHWMK